MSQSYTRTHIVAPADLINEVDRLVGQRKRSEFITAAVDEKLKREKLLRAARAMSNHPPVRGIPEWDTPESASQWVRDIREESDRARKV